MFNLKFLVLIFAVLQVSHGRVFEQTYERTGLDEVQQFIVGGTATTIAAHPWAFFMQVGNSVCGAFNIHRLWGLTAAHCLHNLPAASTIQLRGGSTNRNQGFIAFTVQSYALHPNYTRTTLDFDVAVLRANTPFEGHANVRPIALPAACSAACCGVCTAGNNVIVAGWGQTNGGGLPANLLQVSKPIQSCVGSGWTNITPSMFCLLVEQGRDSCNGDSGSAATRVIGGTTFAVGIVSFGTAVCGQGTRPAVYARIERPEIRNWIRTATLNQV